jgi:hypothetical protein
MVRLDSDTEDNIPRMPNPPTIAGSTGAGGGPSIPLAARISGRQPSRTPSPPRALFRSTTGKGNAFTEEDVTFLIRYMEYRK